MCLCCRGSPTSMETAARVASVLARVGDKWSVFVIMMLGEKPRRFNELKRMIGGISQRMLTLTLRGLERDGLITRDRVSHHSATRRLRIDRSRRGLCEPVVALGAWAHAHQSEIGKRAREI